MVPRDDLAPRPPLARRATICCRKSVYDARDRPARRRAGLAYAAPGGHRRAYATTRPMVRERLSPRVFGPGLVSQRPNVGGRTCRYDRIISARRKSPGRFRHAGGARKRRFGRRPCPLVARPPRLPADATRGDLDGELGASMLGSRDSPRRRRDARQLAGGGGLLSATRLCVSKRAWLPCAARRHATNAPRDGRRCDVYLGGSRHVRRPPTSCAHSR